jgi:D-tyrosyl-tRNA(Tyr) deacylase
LKVVIQRVLEASVVVDEKIHSEIKQGLLVLVGFEHEDTPEDLQWTAKKIVDLRIFNDPNGLMNLSVQDINGDVLVVSQFTLHAATKKGNRPSFIKAARPEVAIPLYEQFIKIIDVLIGKKCKTGVFGADMKVSLINDGPVTIILDSKMKE